MKILIDIGHPGQVHYFRNFISIMTKKGHEFLIMARNKEVTFSLLKFYKIEYYSRGKGGKGLLGKLLYIFKADILILIRALKFKPDMFLSFASTYAAHVSYFIKKPHYTFDDTEHSKLELLMYSPFTNLIFTPKTFKKSFKEKHFRFDSFMELCYLHPNYFKPNTDVLNKLNINTDQSYVLLRFVSWKASHDVGSSGLTIQNKTELIQYLEKSHKLKVFISSEDELPDHLQKYKLEIPAENLHDILAFAMLYIGEGGTTATEASLLGIPSILINPMAKLVGSHNELMNDFKIQFFYDNIKESYKKIDEILSNKESKNNFNKRKNTLLLKKINLTSFMVWLFDNYPNSIDTIKKNPDYQYNFK